MEDEGDVDQGVVEVVLVAEEAVLADVFAVVAADDEEGVLPLAGVLERRPEFTELIVDVGEFGPVEPAEQVKVAVGNLVIVAVVGPRVLSDRGGRLVRRVGCRR